MTVSTAPTVALATGCPAGIGAELAAHVLAADIPAGTRLVAYGDARVLAKGAAAMGVTPRARMLARDEAIPAAPGVYFVDLANLDPATIAVGSYSEGASAFAIASFSAAIDLAMTGAADAVAWTPFNKASMRLTHPAYEDEIVFTAERTGFTGTASEFNILPALWNARVTSHVPLSRVAALITFDTVLSRLRLTDRAMRASGFARPRIAVAALNPHAGDGGNFGREEIEVLEPVVAAARREGIACDGPFPSDTVFVRARRGDYDGVLTMFHDQGQIAMKLLGFEAGVTLLGGFDFPLVTPAHGSAYDIAYKGVAETGAMANAMAIAFRMAAARRTADAQVA